MLKHYLILMCWILTMLHVKLKMKSQILVEVFRGIKSNFMEIVMRKEVDKNYQFLRMLLFNCIYTWELEKSEILTEM